MNECLFFVLERDKEGFHAALEKRIFHFSTFHCNEFFYLAVDFFFLSVFLCLDLLSLWILQ
jgi:hypothetical protein